MSTTIVEREVALVDLVQVSLRALISSVGSLEERDAMPRMGSAL